MLPTTSGSPSWRILAGDCREQLATLEPGSVQTCVTSPPYFGLRDYGHAGQIGNEPNLLEYVTNLRDVFRAVHRVLRDDGTLWLNLGDSYDKGKGLIGVPWRVAQRLKQDGWVLRSDIIWSKPNPMPESVTDRPTKAHEYLFLLSKSPRYFYDADAIREANDPASVAHHDRYSDTQVESPKSRAMVDAGFPMWQPNNGGVGMNPAGRNRRTVWTVATQPFPGAHFATFPPKLIEPCILAGSAPGDTVLDPFSGAGTTGMVALRHDRSYIGCELNPEYVELSRSRIIDDCPMWNTFAEFEESA